MDKYEYREEVLKELREQRLLLKVVKKNIDDIGFLIMIADIFLFFITFIVLFK